MLSKLCYFFALLQASEANEKTTVNMSDIVPRFAPFTVQCHCFSPSFLLIKLVHNCYLNSIFFPALLKAWETNEKGTENMSDMPRFAPFTMQLKKQFWEVPRIPHKVSGILCPRFRLAMLVNGFSGFFKSLLERLRFLKKHEKTNNFKTHENGP